MSENRWHAYIKTTAANAPVRGDMSVAGYAHRLQWNENPYDFPEDLKEAVMTRFAERAWARYPTEFRPRELIAASGPDHLIDDFGALLDLYPDVAGG